MQLRLLTEQHFLHVLLKANCREGRSGWGGSIKLTPKSLYLLEQLPGWPNGTSFSFLDSEEGHPRDSEPMELMFELEIDKSSCANDIDLPRHLRRGSCMRKGS